jgi:hypothetical protein
MKFRLGTHGPLGGDTEWRHLVATPVFTAVDAAATVPGTAELSLSRWTRSKKQYF